MLLALALTIGSATGYGAFAQEVTMPGQLAPMTPHAPTIPRVAPRKTNEVRLIDEFIHVTPIDAVRSDTVGLFPAGTTGITKDFWGQSTAETLAPLIARFDPDALAAAKALRLQIILTQLDTPGGSDVRSAILVARLDYLISSGALEQAEALLHSANAAEPELYKRWFDVGLLSQRAEPVCQATLQNMELAPSYAHRIFCLARDNRWFDAALTLQVGDTAGLIDPIDVELLEMFLDPELFDGDPAPLTHATLTPLRFVLHEALGQPRSVGILPLAYLHADLQNRVGWRDRLLATERLVQSQSFGPGMLDFVYSEANPAASGGIWDRVKHYQSLKKALHARDAERAAQALNQAVSALAATGLLHSLAKQFEPQWLDALLTQDAQNMRFMMSALAADGKMTPALPPAITPDQWFIRDLLSDQENAHPVTELQRAIQSGLTQHHRARSAQDVASERRTGERVLRALELLELGGANHPGNLETVLAILIKADLARDARAIAVEVLVNAQVAS